MITEYLDRAIRQTRQGGIYEMPEDTPQHVRDRLNWTIQRINALCDYCTLEINLGPSSLTAWNLIADSRLGAIAIVDSEAELNFIGINVGSVFVLFDSFARLLCNPQAFPTIGNAQDENIERAIQPLKKFNDSFYLAPVEPIDPVRREFSYWLALIALEFLFLHEHTHIRHGHVEWYKKKTGLPFSDALNFGLDRSGTLQNQALEMDADSAALDWLLKRSIDIGRKFANSDTPIDSPRRIVYAQICADPSSLLSYIAYAVYMMYRIMYTPEFKPDQLCSGSHPQPPLRQLMMGMLTLKLCEINPQYGISLDQALKVCRYAAVYAEQNYAATGGVEIDKSAMQFIFGGENMHKVQCYLWKLHKAWSSMRPDLERLKRGGTLAPANHPENIVIPYAEDYSFGLNFPPLPD